MDSGNFCLHLDAGYVFDIFNTFCVKLKSYLVFEVVYCYYFYKIRKLIVISCIYICI